jgi:isopenicillin N synthase-like dioxygenase
MAQLGRDIAVKILHAFDIDEAVIKTATGGLSENAGKISLKVAHYDESKDGLGIQWHKDLRWVTVLYAFDEGLEAKIGNQPINAAPKDGYFFVNLGVFFEAFINDINKLNALVHQVRHVEKSRSSFIVLCEGNYKEKGFYELINSTLHFEPDTDKIRARLIKDPEKLVSTAPQIIFSNYNSS